MFKDIISRDNGCPWGSTNLTSKLWLDIPVHELFIADLVATQPGILLHALKEDASVPYGGDIHPHVVLWNHTYYLEDGHHRVVRARISGQDTIFARLFVIDK